MSKDRWRNLEIWKLADDLAYYIYVASREFPREELFGLTSQLRRAALSVPTNMVKDIQEKGTKN